MEGKQEAHLKETRKHLNMGAKRTTELSFQKQNENKSKCPSIQRFAIFERELFFRKLSGFARLSFWEQQHEDEDECGAMVE